MTAFLRAILAPRRAAVLLGVLAACVLVGLFGAWLFGAILAPPSRRMLAILAILALWLAIEALLFWHRRRANARLLNGLQQVRAAAPAGEDEVLDAQLREAFDLLRSEQIGRGLASDFAYALPWYLLIGPPAAGKSALVAHSHLRMPIEEQLGRRGIAVQNQATRWWFTEDALLISAPIAGEVPHADPQVAPGAPPGRDPWQGVMAFLARYRPRRPLDGVVVAVPADLLVGGQGAALVATLRARLADAMRVLAVRLQVYVVVTQCDRLTGFTEFFAGLDAEARMRAFGVALPARPSRAPAAGGLAMAAQLRRMLDASLARMSAMLPFHSAAERDPQRRARMSEWPEQFAVLADAAAEFAAALASAGRFDRQMLLRGVFFTAIGDMPSQPLLDGWSARFAEPLGMRVASVPARRPAAPAPLRLGAEHGHADEADHCFFIPGLFRDVIFPEAGLAGRNPRIERRLAGIHFGAYGLCLLALLASASLWLRDYASRQAILGEFRSGLAKQQVLAANANPASGLEAVLPLLDQARALAGLAEDHNSMARYLGISPLNIDPARKAAVNTYHALLVSRLLPVLAQNLGQQLHQAIATGAGADTLRPLLATYLMLGEPAHYSAATVGDWARQLITAGFVLEPQRRDDALAHLQTLLTLLPAPVTLDPNLVLQARAQLRQSPDAELIYARLKQESLHSGVAQPLDVVGALGNAGAQLLMLRSQAGLPVVVPALYTRDGFYQIFLKRAPELVRNADASDWVMGARNVTDPVLAKLVLQQVTDRYVQDYIKQWQTVLSQMSLHALPDMASLVGGLQTLSGPQSPLIQFIQLVKMQTDLGLPAPAPSVIAQAGAAVGAVAGKAAAAAQPAVQSAAAELGSVPANPLGLADWPGDTIRTPFLPLQALVSPSTATGQAPVLRVQDTLVAAYGVVSGIASAQDPATAAQQATAKVISGQGGDPLIGLRVQAATLPQPINGIFRALYENIWSTLLQMTRESIQADWARAVAPVCQQAVALRYPFVQGGDQGSSVDVTLQDFSNFFGRGGVMDDFIAKNLVPFTTPGAGGALSQSAQNGLSLGLSSQAMAEINLARRIGNLFFGSNGNVQLAFTMTPTYLDPRAVSAVLSIDQTKLDYRHQPPRATAFQWPPVNAAGTASLIVTGTDGQTHEIQTSGPWALFRLLDQAQRTAPGGSDQTVYSFTLGGLRASFGLRAASVNNPFTDQDYRGFRCVPRL